MIYGNGDGPVGDLCSFLVYYMLCCGSEFRNLEAAIIYGIRPTSVTSQEVIGGKLKLTAVGSCLEAAAGGLVDWSYLSLQANNANHAWSWSHT